jgi:hypothetical protein
VRHCAEWRREHGLELLGDADGNDAWSAGPLEVGPHDLDLTVVFAEVQHRDATFLGKGSHRGAEAVAYVREEGRRRDGLIAVVCEKRRELARDLEVRNVALR